MNKEGFFLVFCGKYLFLLGIIIFVIIRYARKGVVRINTNVMIECKIKEICKRYRLWINIIMNVVLCVAMCTAFFGGIIPAIKDLPYVIKGKVKSFQGSVTKGSSINSTNKMETYNIIVTIDGEEKRLYVYGKNGIKTNDYIRVQYLPNTGEGVLIKNER